MGRVQGIFVHKSYSVYPVNTKTARTHRLSSVPAGGVLVAMIRLRFQRLLQIRDEIRGILQTAGHPDETGRDPCRCELFIIHLAMG